jgi:CubicO group peptidase (beta-lactamase class C family)
MGGPHYVLVRMHALDAVARWPVGSAAAAVVVIGDRSDPGSGHREANPQVRGSAGPTDRPFRWASITKMATTLSVLIAVEEHTLALDDPAGPPGSTVAHLLAHASGLGLSAPEPIAAPGHRRIYSNVGFELLAGLLAERSGMAFAEYLTEGVLDPLGMGATTLAPGASAASGMVGPVGDLTKLAAELLSPGLVSAASLAAATTVAFPGLDGVLPGYGRQTPCDWGLGFEIKGTKRPHWTGTRNSPATFGHFGQAGGFVWVDPDAGVACVSLSDTDFGAWAALRWPKLSDAVLAELAS